MHRYWTLQLGMMAGLAYVWAVFGFSVLSVAFSVPFLLLGQHFSRHGADSRLRYWATYVVRQAAVNVRPSGAPVGTGVAQLWTGYAPRAEARTAAPYNVRAQNTPPLARDWQGTPLMLRELPKPFKQALRRRITVKST